MKSRNRLVIALSIFGLVLLMVGITYAYFTAIITGKETASSIVITGGIMTIEYSENSNVIQIENIYPREEAWFTKTITLTGTNTTDLQMKYDLGINVTNNTFSHYLSYDLTLIEGDNGTPIPNITNKAIVGTGYKRFGVGVFNTANAEVHKYELKIYLKDNGLNQNDVQNALFNGKVVIEESGTTNPNEEITMFLTGKEVNIKMKKLANIANNDETEVQYATDQNTTITAIKLSNTLKEGLTAENVVSTDTSKYPIYMWYEDGVIYYYSEANKLYLNSDSSQMFLYLYNLSDLSGLKNFDSSRVINMNSMFCWSTSITNLEDVSNWDVSNVTDMYAMFSGYSTEDRQGKIQSLKPLTNWDVGKVETMKWMFSFNTSLTSLEGLENWDVSSVEDMMWMFASNLDNLPMHLESISALSNWDTSSVKKMSYMFARNESLTSLEPLSNWDTSNVTSIQNMFLNSLSLENLNGLENWDVSNVVYMNGTFGINGPIFSAGSFSKITDISALSNWDTSKVESLYMMFQGLKLLPNIDAVKNWNVSDVTDLDYMFFGDKAITEGDLSNWNMSNVTDATSMFGSCSGLVRLKTPKVYPSDINVKITLPGTFNDSLGTSYTTLDNTSPTETWLTK